MYLYLFSLISTTSCTPKKQRLSLINHLPKQVKSIPIGMTYDAFKEEYSDRSFENITLTPDLFFLKESLTSENPTFIQYQFQNNQLNEVVVGYTTTFAAKDAASELYGSSNDNGTWLGVYQNINITIQVLDSTIVYR